MTIKQQGGIFGRNPTFNDVEVDGSLSVDGDLLFTDTSNDRIGINTNSPGVTLDVNGGSTTQLRLTAADSTSASIINFGDQANVAVGRIIYSHVTDSFSFKTNNVNNRLTIDNSGNVTVGNGNLVMGTSGSGIDFSATSGTGTSELFDDYEEGTWTGTYGGSTADGSYTKIGRLVYAAITLTANSESFSTISGLPFTSATAGYEGGYWGRCLRADILDANGVPCRITVSGTSINFHTNAAGGADGAFTVTTDASGAVRLGLSVVYYV